MTEAILPTVAGMVASWWITRWYYRKSGTDLDAALRPIAGDAQKSLHAVSVLGRVLEQRGTGKLTYDAAGNLTGLVITGAAHSTASFGPTASATVERGTPPQYDRQHEQPLPDEKGNPHA